MPMGRDLQEQTEITEIQKLAGRRRDLTALNLSCANSGCVIGLGGSGLVIGMIEVRKMGSEI
jgi:hypothetical protein